jgi:hypothetical protein
VPATPEELLAEAPVAAAVAALAERNRHHFEAMSEPERGEAILHWRDLVLSVLTAAGAQLSSADQDETSSAGAPGRAVIVFEDSGEEQIAVHASFFPQLEDLGNGEVAGTPAQAAALELLNDMAGGGE